MNLTRAYVKKHLEVQEPPIRALKGPLFVLIQFRMPLPQFMKSQRRELMHRYPHVKRPDGDNLEKFLNDALNGVLWSDDSSIAFLYRSKTYTKAKTGETLLFVRELESSVPDYNLILSDIRENIKPEEQDA